MNTPCIRHERSGVESYPYQVKEGPRYINLNPGQRFVQQPPKKGKGSWTWNSLPSAVWVTTSLITIWQKRETFLYHLSCVDRWVNLDHRIVDCVLVQSALQCSCDCVTVIGTFFNNNNNNNNNDATYECRPWTPPSSWADGVRRSNLSSPLYVISLYKTWDRISDKRLSYWI